MQRFVITASSLYTDKHAISVIRNYNLITLIEDPVLMVATSSKSKLVALRAALKSYALWLASIVPDATITYVLRSQVAVKGPTIFDYLVGSEAQIHMWRQDLTLHEYGDAPFVYTYCGIGIKFIDHPDAWNLKFRDVRDNMKTRSATTIKLQILDSIAGISADLRTAVAKIINTRDISKFQSRIININMETNDLYKAAVEHVTRTYTECNGNNHGRYAVNVIECKQLVDIFMGKILPLYQYGDLLCMHFALDRMMVLLPTMMKLIANAQCDFNARAVALADCCTYEFARVLYILDGKNKVASTSILKTSINVLCRDHHDAITRGEIITMQGLRSHCVSMRVCSQTKALCNLTNCAYINRAFAFMLTDGPIAACDLAIAKETFPKEYEVSVFAGRKATADPQVDSTTEATPSDDKKAPDDNKTKHRHKKKSGGSGGGDIESTDPLEILKSLTK